MHRVLKNFVAFATHGGGIERGILNDFAKNICSIRRTSTVREFRDADRPGVSGVTTFHDDADDEDELEFQPFVVKKHPPVYFYRLCQRLVGEGKLAECVAVVEKRMLEDRVRPEKYNYTVVIHALGRAGQPRKAFEFYGKMMKAGYRSSPFVAASLFNACANAAPADGQYAAGKARQLVERERRNHGSLLPNMYFAAMKCFARLGDLPTVFRLADDMLRDGYAVGQKIFTYLLYAALQDKQSGFKLALDIWSARNAMGVKPNIYDYRLLTKICRDCGVGEKGNAAMEKIVNDRFRKLTETRRPLRSADATGLRKLENSDGNDAASAPAPVALVDDVTNVALRTCNLRFSLIGGFEEFVKRMAADRVTPDVVVCSSLIYLMPHSRRLEIDLIDYARKRNVKLDTEFYNSLIYRRSIDGDREHALDLLKRLIQDRLSPDFRTFTALGQLCSTETLCLTLIRDMTKYGIEPELPLFEIFLRKAFNRNNFHYARTVLSQMAKFSIHPSESMLIRTEQRLAAARQQMLAKDKSQDRSDTLDLLRKGYNEFMDYYNRWIDEVKVHRPKDPRRTALQIRVETDDLREDWEKPWVAQQKKLKETIELGDVRVVP